MISILTTCRPFDDASDDGKYIAAIQRYSFRTLKELEQEVIVIYDDGGVADVVEEFGFKHYYKRVKRHESGAPSLKHVFDTAIKRASRDTLMYTNADILYLDDLLPAVEALQESGFDKWMATGGRWDVNPRGRQPWPIGAECWQQIVRNEMFAQDRYHGGGALDYFIFTRGLYEDIPETLSIAAWRWDNWMIWKALQDGAQVIDLSAAVSPIHLDHPATGVRENEEAVRANGEECKGKVCTTSNSQWRMTKDHEIIPRGQ